MKPNTAGQSRFMEGARTASHNVNKTTPSLTVQFSSKEKSSCDGLLQSKFIMKKDLGKTSKAKINNVVKKF